MTEIPQPAPEPYSPGDQVRIYLDPADPDASTHDTVCEITDVVKDDLDTETGRSTDAYSYRLRELETDEKLPLAFRHQAVPRTLNIPMSVLGGYLMSRDETKPLRHVPSAACTRCGATVDPDRFQYALRDSTPAEKKGTIESGNLCEDCFNDVLTVVREDVDNS